MSLPGARMLFESGRKWVNPYVTDGLVAMWDGEWNAGGGVHNDTISGYVDLTGNNHAFHAPSPIWGDNYNIIGVPTGEATTINSIFRSDASESAWLRSLIEGGNYSLEWCIWPTTNLATSNYFCSISQGSGIFSRMSVMNSNTTRLEFYPQGSGRRYSPYAALNYLAKRFDHVSVSGSNGLVYESGAYSEQTDIVPIQMQSNWGFAFGYRGDLYNPNTNSGDGLILYRLAIYDRALSLDEIQYNESIDKARFDLP